MFSIAQGQPFSVILVPQASWDQQAQHENKWCFIMQGSATHRLLLLLLRRVFPRQNNVPVRSQVTFVARHEPQLNCMKLPIAPANPETRNDPRGTAKYVLAYRPKHRTMREVSLKTSLCLHKADACLFSRSPKGRARSKLGCTLQYKYPTHRRQTEIVCGQRPPPLG